MVSTRLVFVSGKGGTGKSAVTAGLAIARARAGETVLAIDMAASPGLATHLGVEQLAYRPQEIRDGLHAMSIDRAAALDEYLKLQLHVPLGAPTRQIAGALSVLAETAPGVREIISIGKPVFETWRGTWDTVVVDAPSLGQFQSYIRAPRTIAELVPTGNVRRQAATLESTIGDPDTTSIVFVTNPSELPMNETLESIEIFRSDALGTVPRIAMNRVLGSAGIDGSSLGEIPEGPVREAATLQTTLEHEQSVWIAATEAHWTLPYLRGVLTPLEVALQLSDAIDGSR
ncbi:MAG: hypothetical protein M3132_15475 [Actinomycetia bacterium]|nr:hypothetical protein [Actinomycetes bacterium]